MTGTGPRWIAAITLSVGVHAAVLAGLALSLRPRAMPPQKPPTSEVEFVAQEVRQSRAGQEQLASAPVAGQSASGPAVGAQDIRVTRPAASQVTSPRAAEATPGPRPLAATPAAAPSLSDTRVAAPRLADAPLAGPSLPDVPASAPAAANVRLATSAIPATLAAASIVEDRDLPSTSTAALAQSGPALPDQPPAAPQLLANTTDPVQPVAQAPSSLTVREQRPGSLAVALQASDAPLITTASPAGQKSSELAPEPTAVAPALTASGPAPLAVQTQPTAIAQAQSPAFRPTATAPPARPGRIVAAASAPLPEQPAGQSAQAAGAVAPQAVHLTAAVAWIGGDAGAIDPISLAAFQSFMQPSDPNAEAAGSPVRDGLEAVLAAVPCSRLQTEFNPDTGVLELRGHVPDDAVRGPVLAAVQARVGDAIPVADATLVLPPPQCGALAGIGGVGLPQSDDQRTNPRIVGPNAHVREFRYGEGERLELELTAPDYDAYVYIDYFDADGNVLHLQPNDVVPVGLAAAKSPLTSGVERDGLPALILTVSPPFGQEIAVAFAASVPLYDGLRPIMEPAEPYLEFLTKRVADARAAHPDFKGEWVYFFITTRPAGQLGVQ